ncbi:hypothetical protein SNEBB_003642 [Seison nebaliae]|nr:hypothetical protein SNEBB_003642 [Seison nebaliae]
MIKHSKINSVDSSNGTVAVRDDTSDSAVDIRIEYHYGTTTVGGADTTGTGRADTTAAGESGTTSAGGADTTGTGTITVSNCK